MGTNPTKTIDNSYCRCRKEVTKYMLSRYMRTLYKKSLVEVTKRILVVLGALFNNFFILTPIGEQTEV